MTSLIDEERFTSLVMWTGMTIEDVAECEAKAAAEELNRSTLSVQSLEQEDIEMMEHWSSCLGLASSRQKLSAASSLSKGVEVYIPDKVYSKIHHKMKQNFNFCSLRGATISSVAPEQGFALSLITAIRETQPEDSWRWTYGGNSLLLTDFGVIRIVRETSTTTVDEIRSKLSNFAQFVTVMEGVESSATADSEISTGNLSTFKPGDDRKFIYIRPASSRTSVSSFLSKSRGLCAVLTKVYKKHFESCSTDEIADDDNDDDDDDDDDDDSDGMATFIDLRSIVSSRSPDATPDLIAFISWLLVSQSGCTELNIFLPIEIFSSCNSREGSSPAVHSRSQDALMSAVCVPTVRPLSHFTTKSVAEDRSLRGALVTWQRPEATDAEVPGCKPLAEARAKTPGARLRRQAASLNP